MGYEEMIGKLEARRAELVAKSNKSESVEELRSIQKQLEVINGDINDLRQMRGSAENPPLDERTAAVTGAEKRDNPPQFTPGKGFTAVEERGATDYSKIVEAREKAGAELREKRSAKMPFGLTGELRSVVIGDGKSIVVPQTFTPIINPDFPTVSSLIDAVGHLSISGGESFRQPYITGIDVGEYTAEGGQAAQAETHFDYVDITKTKATAYAEISEELLKLPNAPYADVIFQNIRTSMRMLLAKEIVAGAGDTNQIVGIFSEKATAIESDTDLVLSTINDTTLDEIVYNYGGDEEVESPAVLILSKADLLSFAKVRTSTTLRYYDIQSQGNFGTINGVPFIINSACKALTASGTAKGVYCMAYGNLTNYQLVEFSPMEVTQSTDYKFRDGMTAYRGVSFVGGNVVKKNGFLRIKKK